MRARPLFFIALLCAWVTLAQRRFVAAKHRVVRWILDLRARRNFDNFQNVEFGCWVLFTLHNQNVLEALVVSAAVQNVAVAQTRELEVFKSFTNSAWVERPGTVDGVCIKQRLAVNGVSRLDLAGSRTWCRTT